MIQSEQSNVCWDTNMTHNGEVGGNSVLDGLYWMTRMGSVFQVSTR
jgi:hypothetical protein